MTTPIAQIPELAANLNNKYLVHNEALRKIEALGLGAVETASLTAPPTSDTEGKLYIVASPATGAWAGLENKIVQRTASGYQIISVFDGLVKFNKATSGYLRWTGSTWATQIAVNAANNAVQLGEGSNNNPNSLQFLNNAIANEVSLQVKVQATGVAPTSTPPNGTIVLDSVIPALFARLNGAWMQLT